MHKSGLEQQLRFIKQALTLMRAITCCKARQLGKDGDMLTRARVVGAGWRCSCKKEKLMFFPPKETLQIRARRTGQKMSTRNVIWQSALSRGNHQSM